MKLCCVVIRAREWWRSYISPTTSNIVVRSVVHWKTDLPRYSFYICGCNTLHLASKVVCKGTPLTPSFQGGNIHAGTASPCAYISIIRSCNIPFPPFACFKIKKAVALVNNRYVVQICYCKYQAIHSFGNSHNYPNPQYYPFQSLSRSILRSHKW